MDAIQPGRPARDVQVVGGDKNELTRYLQAAMRTMKLVPDPEEDIERGYYYRSDHFSFAKRGVPMFNLGRGTDWVTGRPAPQARSRAMPIPRTPITQPSDEYDGKWDWSGPMQDGELFYRLGRSLAMGSDWPNWHKGDEFRAVRDASRTGKK